MSNLTKCKDCGHTVSKKAKTCPSCGVPKPGEPPTSLGTLILTALVIVVSVVWFVNSLDDIRQIPNSSSRNQSATTATTRIFTDAQIQETIAQSDDYEAHRAAFTKAANFLLTKSRCTRQELKEYGGFVKAQGGYKNQPIYFTYCGGMKTSNRFYVDADTGLVSQ